MAVDAHLGQCEPVVGEMPQSSRKSAASDARPLAEVSLADDLELADVGDDLEFVERDLDLEVDVASRATIGRSSMLAPPSMMFHSMVPAE